MKRVFEVGYVARTRGLNGELAVKCFDPGSETLLDVSRVLLRKDGVEREHTLLSARPIPKEILLSVKGVTTQEVAQSLVGSTVLVFREDLSVPSEGEYFLGDLVGLTALGLDGRTLGIVEEVWDTGPVPNLVIRSEGREIIVPFADEFVEEVRMEERQLVVRPPEFWE